MQKLFKYNFGTSAMTNISNSRREASERLNSSLSKLDEQRDRLVEKRKALDLLVNAMRKEGLNK